MGFVTLPGADWLARPTLLPAVLYGLGTVILPPFVMQPALGFGIASARTPNPPKARAKSIATHLVFGLAFYACARVLGG